MKPDERQLLLEISQPSPDVIQSLSKLQGDLLLLGAGGKIGHGLALMAQRAFEEAGKKNRVLAVSRYGSAAAQKALEDDGITTVACDLSDTDAVANLPDASDIIYLAGQKFGTADGPSTTWLLNTVVPGVVSRRFPKSRIAFYSSGNVYPFTSPAGPNPLESHEVSPIGEYAQSVLGRERIFEYYSRTQKTPMTNLRLVYANEPRYGVLVDIATWILNREPVPINMGYVNILWQGDCNRVTLRSLEIAASPTRNLNLGGVGVFAVKDLATKLGKVLGVQPTFTGEPAATALLIDSAYCWRQFGPQLVDADQMIEKVGQWLKAGGPTMGKPTHFEVRTGKF